MGFHTFSLYLSVNLVCININPYYVLFVTRLETFESILMGLSCSFTPLVKLSNWSLVKEEENRFNPFKLVLKLEKKFFLFEFLKIFVNIL